MPKLWLTYAWKDKDEAELGYIVQKLQRIGVDTYYDKIELVPGPRLWEQISEQILHGQYDGWAYLITPNSVANEECREGLAYALHRAQTGKKGLTLIGLLNQVAFDDIPASLRVGQFVDLGDPQWAERLRAALEQKPPEEPAEPESKYFWQVHTGYQGVESHTAIEVRPRSGELRNWKFLVPGPPTNIVFWGYGASGGGPAALVKTAALEGTMALPDGTLAGLYGQTDPLSATTSAYIIFEGELPAFVFFGASAEPMQMPSEWEALHLE